MSENIVLLQIAKIVQEIEDEQKGDHDSGEILVDLIAQLKSMYSREISDVEKDIVFLWSLMPPWVKETPPGLDPTMYGTLSAEGDAGIAKKLQRVFERMRNNAQT